MKRLMIGLAVVVVLAAPLRATVTATRDTETYVSPVGTNLVSAGVHVTNLQPIAVVEGAALPAGANAIGAVAPIGASTLATSQAPVSTALSQVVAARTGVPGTGRAAVTLRDIGTADAYCGPAGTTALTGFLIRANDAMTWAIQSAVYCLTASGTSTIAVAETY